MRQLWLRKRWSIPICCEGYGRSIVALLAGAHRQPLVIVSARSIATCFVAKHFESSKVHDPKLLHRSRSLTGPYYSVIAGTSVGAAGGRLQRFHIWPWQEAASGQVSGT